MKNNFTYFLLLLGGTQEPWRQTFGVWQLKHGCAANKHTQKKEYRAIVGWEYNADHESKQVKLMVEHMTLRHNWWLSTTKYGREGFTVDVIPSKWKSVRYALHKTIVIWEKAKPIIPTQNLPFISSCLIHQITLTNLYPTISSHLHPSRKLTLTVVAVSSEMFHTHTNSVLTASKWTATLTIRFLCKTKKVKKSVNRTANQIKWFSIQV